MVAQGAIAPLELVTYFPEQSTSCQEVVGKAAALVTFGQPSKHVV